MSQCGYTNENASGSTLSPLLNQNNPRQPSLTLQILVMSHGIRRKSSTTYGYYHQHPLPINWQKFAREHGITGGNAGQITREFAMASGVNTERLDGKSETQHPRVRWRRLLGVEISVPSTPTLEVVKKEWNKLMDDGEISLGRPYVLYNMVRYATKDGQLEKRELTIVGRKFPLLQIRQYLLSKHEKYVHLTTKCWDRKHDLQWS